jgi:uncharacterized hydrophobic protein (TIGR00341 family)
MALRLLECYYPNKKNQNIKTLLKDIDVIDVKQDEISDKLMQSKILIPADKTDTVIEILDKAFSKSKDYRLIILPVEAAVPRPENNEKKERKKSEDKKQERISIEEIYEDVCGEISTFSKSFFALSILASIVAAIGILYNNVAVIIGSMVIAPLLNPSMALSLGITLADTKLIKKAILISFLGFSLAVLIGFIFGLLLIIDPSSPEIASRTDLSLMYVILAFSGGIAGSLSITRGLSEALVGVMVAVALLPPLVTSGLLLGSNYITYAIGALLLFFVNFVCINLAGVLTFAVQGVNPRKWWEKKKAKKTVWKAILSWIFLLCILLIMIVIYQYF